MGGRQDLSTDRLTPCGIAGSCTSVKKTDVADRDEMGQDSAGVHQSDKSSDDAQQIHRYRLNFISEVFLSYPAVPIDTNHIEPGLRPIAMGKNNWMFCWADIGGAGMNAVGLFPRIHTHPVAITSS